MPPKIAAPPKSMLLKILPSVVEDIAVAEISVEAQASEEEPTAEAQNEGIQDDANGINTPSSQLSSEDGGSNVAEEDEEDGHEDGANSSGGGTRGARTHQSAIKLNKNANLPEAVKETIKNVQKETEWDGRSNGMPNSHYMEPFTMICTRSGVDMSYVDDKFKSTHKGTQAWLSAVKKYAYSAARSYRRKQTLDDDASFAPASLSEGPNLRKRKRGIHYSGPNNHYVEIEDDDSIADRDLAPGDLARMQRRADTAQLHAEREAVQEDTEPDESSEDHQRGKIARIQGWEQQKFEYKHDYLDTYSARLAAMAERTHEVGLKMFCEWMESLKNPAPAGQQLPLPPAFPPSVDFTKMIYTPEMLQGHIERALVNV